MAQIPKLTEDKEDSYQNMLLGIIDSLLDSLEAPVDNLIQEKEKEKQKLILKEKELEELRQYHNKCCQEFEKEKQDLLDKYNQLSKDLHSGEFCNTEKCELLNDKQKEKNQIKFEIYQELLTILNSTSEIYKDDSLDIKLQAGLQEAIFRLVKEPMIGDEDYE